MIDVLQYLPNCKLYSTVKQEDDEEAWLKARTRGIGGSEVGAICGVNNYYSVRTVYLKKTGQFTEPDGGEFSESSIERMYFGSLLEPVVAAEYCKRSEKNVVKAPGTFSHKDFPWAIANIDRFIVDEEGKPIGVLEVKTAGDMMKDAWKEGEIPLSYIYQLNWYLWITGLKYGAFACLVGGNKFYWYEVIRNDELLNELIIPKATKFWEYNVKNLIEPDLDGSPASTEFINELAKECKKNSEMMIAEQEYNELAETVVTCKKKIKELEHIEDEAANRIKDKLRDAEIGYTSDYVIKWSPQKQSRIDTEILKRLYPDVANNCTKTIEFRRFTIKGG